jgi:hypothetical protein
MENAILDALKIKPKIQTTILCKQMRKRILFYFKKPSYVMYLR